MCLSVGCLVAVNVPEEYEDKIDRRDYVQTFADVIEALSRVEEFLRKSHYTSLDLFRSESPMVAIALTLAIEKRGGLHGDHVLLLTHSKAHHASHPPRSSPSVGFSHAVCDTDHSGSLSRDELVDRLLIIGLPITYGQARRLVTFLDGGHSDEIEYPEFEDALRHVSARGVRRERDQSSKDVS